MYSFWIQFVTIFNKITDLIIFANTSMYGTNAITNHKSLPTNWMALNELIGIDDIVCKLTQNKSCFAFQTCYTDLVVTPTGQLVYEAGCRSKQVHTNVWFI